MRDIYSESGRYFMEVFLSWLWSETTHGVIDKFSFAGQVSPPSLNRLCFMFVFFSQGLCKCCKMVIVPIYLIFRMVKFSADKSIWVNGCIKLTGSVVDSRQSTAPWRSNGAIMH